MIKVKNGTDEASAYLADSRDGWIVKVNDAFKKERRFYPFTGGAFLLNKDGTPGRQLRGTSDERAPKSAPAMRAFLTKYVLGTI